MSIGIKSNVLLKSLLSLVVASMSLSVFALTEVVDGITWTYMVSNGAAVIGGGKSSSIGAVTAVPTTTTGAIAIPSTLGGYAVKGINYGAFYRCYDLTSVTIPDSITSMGNYVFAYCSSLTSITIPNCVKSIGDGAFYKCSALTSVVIDDGVMSIGQDAFSDCSSLTSIIIPNSVIKIGQCAFDGCRGMTSVIISESVTSIEGYAFRSCSSLTSVSIPNGVTTIGAQAFYGCSGLTGVTIPDSVTSIGTDAFYSCISLSSVKIGNGVTRIASSAFGCCNNMLYDLTTIPGVKLIDGWAFKSTSSPKGDLDLTEIRGIGDYAFNGCKDITSVKIGNRVKGVGQDAFKGCSGLTSVSIPDSVTIIGSEAFYNCSGLISVKIGEGVARIGKNAFYGCNSLKYDLTTIPGVKLIDGWAIGYTDQLSGDLDLTEIRGVGAYAFSSCKDITSVTIGDHVTIIDSGVFLGCQGMTSVTIPESVTSIESAAFKACRGLACVTIPDGVTSIGEWAFDSCTNLASIIISDSVTMIGYAAFSECSNLTSVTIPDSVISIDRYVFSNCSGLTKVKIGRGVKEIGSDLFYRASASCIVCLPIGNSLYEVVDGKWQGMTVEYYGEDVDLPTIEGDENAIVEGDEDSGYTIIPSEDNKVIVITIPKGVEPEKVTVEVRPDVETVRPNGATIRIVNSGKDITSYISESSLEPDSSGVVNLAAAKLDKEAVFAETTEGDNQKSEEAVLTAAMSDDMSAEATVESAKPGLYYSMEASSELGFPDDAEKTKSGMPKLATDTTVTIAKPNERPVGNAVFYRIKVSKTGN